MMRPRRFCGYRGLATFGLPALALAPATTARGQAAAPTVEATSSISGAIPPQSMDTGPLDATAGTRATLSDSFSGPIQIGAVAVGSADVAVSASAGEGSLGVFTRSSATGSVTSIAVLTNVEAHAIDSVQITQLPAGQGQLSAMYFPTMLASGGTVSGSGASWSATVHLTATLEDYAPDGTLRNSYVLAADYTNGNSGALSNDTGPVAIPVQLNDTLTVDFDQTLRTSVNAARGATSTVMADLSGPMRLLLVPQSPALAFTSASAHGYLPLVGDADVDGKTDFADLLTLAQHYGAADATWAQGDFNADGSVGFDDLLALAQHYGQTLDTAPVAPVPEAGSAAVIVGGAACFLRRRRRR